MVVETHGLTKIYGDKTACNSIDLQVGEGEVFGFLGPNGAGKSTCIKMLTGLVHPTSGSGTVLGKPLGDVSARAKIGYLPELFRYQDWMTGIDLLKFHANLLGMKNPQGRIRQVLKQVGLEGQEKYKVGSYSKGMQQRIGLACAILGEPKLLFLDEPTSALDPIGRKEVRDIIVSLKAEGTTVFLNSHLLSEVETVSDRVTFISKGRVARTASIEELVAETLTLSIRAEGVSNGLLQSLENEYGSLEKLSDGRLSLALKDREEIPHVASKIIAAGATLYELTPKHESLESIFMQIVRGEELTS